MTDKSMYIQNEATQNTPSVDCNRWLKRVDTELNDPNNQNLKKVPKVVQPMNEKTLL